MRPSPLTWSALIQFRAPTLPGPTRCPIPAKQSPTDRAAARPASSAARNLASSAHRPLVLADLVERWWHRGGRRAPPPAMARHADRPGVPGRASRGRPRRGRRADPDRAHGSGRSLGPGRVPGSRRTGPLPRRPSRAPTRAQRQRLAAASRACPAVPASSRARRPCRARQQVSLRPALATRRPAAPPRLRDSRRVASRVPAAGTSGMDLAPTARAQGHSQLDAARGHTPVGDRPPHHDRRPGSDRSLPGRTCVADRTRTRMSSWPARPARVPGARGDRPPDRSLRRAGGGLAPCWRLADHSRHGDRVLGTDRSRRLGRALDGRRRADRSRGPEPARSRRNLLAADTRSRRPAAAWRTHHLTAARWHRPRRDRPDRNRRTHRAGRSQPNGRTRLEAHGLPQVDRPRRASVWTRRDRGVRGRWAGHRRRPTGSARPGRGSRPGRGARLGRRAEASHTPRQAIDNPGPDRTFRPGRIRWRRSHRPHRRPADRTRLARTGGQQPSGALLARGPPSAGPPGRARHLVRTWPRDRRPLVRLPGRDRLAGHLDPRRPGTDQAMPGQAARNRLVASALRAARHAGPGSAGPGSAAGPAGASRLLAVLPGARSDQAVQRRARPGGRSRRATAGRLACEAR